MRLRYPSIKCPPLTSRVCLSLSNAAFVYVKSAQLIWLCLNALTSEVCDRDKLREGKEGLAATKPVPASLSHFLEYHGKYMLQGDHAAISVDLQQPRPFGQWVRENEYFRCRMIEASRCFCYLVLIGTATGIVYGLRY